MKQYFYLMLGATLCGVGVGVALSTGLGADPITVFFEGLSNTFHITVGFASLLTMLMCALIAWLFNRNLVGLGTLITPIGVQFGIDGSMAVLPKIQTLPMNVLIWIIGIVIVGFGISMSIAANIGHQGSDALILAIGEKLNLTYPQVRWGTDSFFVIAGILLGGSFQWVCLIAVFALGNIVAFFKKPLEKWIHGYEQ